MKLFLSSSQHYDIIASGVILNPNILRDCITFMSLLIHFKMTVHFKSRLVRPHTYGWPSPSLVNKPSEDN